MTLLLASLGHFQLFSDLAGEVGGEVEDWIAPLIVLGGMVIAAYFTRVVLRNIRRGRASGHAPSRWTYLHRLAPSIASLIYVIGTRLFVELAPISDRLSGWLNNIIYVVAVILILNLIRKAAMIALEISSGLQSDSGVLQQGFVPLTRNLTTLLVFFAGVIMVLRHFDYDVLSLLTALGVGSLAVGLAAQPTLSNMISGFTLIIDRNLRPGDKVNLGGIVGDVDEIGLRSTRIRTGDGNMLIVPNSEMVNSKILNLSVPARETTCSTMIRVSYAASFERVRAIALELMPSIKSGRLVGHEPAVQLTSLADGCQLITIGFWVDDAGAVGSATSELNEKLLKALRAEGIELTGPSPFLRPTV